MNFVHGAYCLDIVQDELEKCLKNIKNISEEDLSQLTCLVKYYDVVDEIDNIKQFVLEVHEFVFKLYKTTENAFILIFADIFVTTISSVS